MRPTHKKPDAELNMGVLPAHPDTCFPPDSVSGQSQDCAPFVSFFKCGSKMGPSQRNPQIN